MKLALLAAVRMPISTRRAATGTPLCGYEIRESYNLSLHSRFSALQLAPENTDSPNLDRQTLRCCPSSPDDGGINSVVLSEGYGCRAFQEKPNLRRGDLGLSKQILQSTHWKRAISSTTFDASRQRQTHEQHLQGLGESGSALGSAIQSPLRLCASLSKSRYERL